MAIRNIVKEGDDILLKKCRTVEKFDRKLAELIDDMLDFTSSSKQMGKTTNVDLKLGISTAPVLFAWKEDPSLGDLIERNFELPGDVERALQLVYKYDGAKKTYELAREYRDKALKNLREALPESDSRSALEFLTNSILTRRK